MKDEIRQFGVTINWDTDEGQMFAEVAVNAYSAGVASRRARMTAVAAGWFDMDVEAIVVATDEGPIN